MDYLKTEEILGRAFVEEKDLYIPEWGGVLRMRGLTKKSQQDLKKESMVNGVLDTDRMEVLLLYTCLIEPKLSMEQIQELIQKSDFSVIDRILNQILNLAGLLPEVREKAIREFYAGFPSTSTESRGGGEDLSIPISQGTENDSRGTSE